MELLTCRRWADSFPVIGIPWRLPCRPWCTYSPCSCSCRGWAGGRSSGWPPQPPPRSSAPAPSSSPHAPGNNTNTTLRSPYDKKLTYHLVQVNTMHPHFALQFDILTCKHHTIHLPSLKHHTTHRHTQDRKVLWINPNNCISIHCRICITMWRLFFSVPLSLLVITHFWTHLESQGMSYTTIFIEITSKPCLVT